MTFNGIQLPTPSVILPFGYVDNQTALANLRRYQAITGQATFPMVRNSSKTAVDRYGNLVTVGANEPTVDFRDGVNLGYSSFVGATNLVERSEEFDNAYWLKTPIGTGVAPVVTANQGIAPDGTQTADKVDFARGDTTGFSLLRSPLISNTAINYTGSIFVKAATSSDIGKVIQLRHLSGAGALSITLTNDWVRIKRTELATGADDRFQIGFFSGLTDLSASALLWGAQLEVGSKATQYIKTEGSTATRSADALTFSNATDLVGQGSGTILITANFDNPFDLVLMTTNVTLTGYNKIGIAYTPTNFTVSINGATVEDVTGTFDFTALDKIEVGHFDGGDQINDNVSGFYLVKQNLKNQLNLFTR